MTPVMRMHLRRDGTRSLRMERAHWRSALALVMLGLCACADATGVTDALELRADAAAYDLATLPRIGLAGSLVNRSPFSVRVDGTYCPFMGYLDRRSGTSWEQVVPPGEIGYACAARVDNTVPPHGSVRVSAMWYPTTPGTYRIRIQTSAGIAVSPPFEAR